MARRASMTSADDGCVDRLTACPARVISVGLVALSKGRFIAGLQCAKRLHLESSAPELRDDEGSGRQVLTQAGIEVGILARGAFPGGVLVAAREWDEAVATTAALVADPTVPAIFEAAFEHAGARVRVDVLARRGAGPLFDLIEVKLASRVREAHEMDLAFQLAVLGAAGLEVAAARMMLLDRAYVHPGGAADPTRLFTTVDLTEKARPLVPVVHQRLATMVAVVADGEAPAIDTGPQCLTPYRCPFFGHCHVGGPDFPVTDLPRLSGEQLAQLAGLGVDDIRDVPADLPGLTPLQLRARAAVLAGGAVREPAVVDLLAAIPLPAHFVDFETFAPAVPVFPGTRRFEQIPFQWSNTVLAADGTVSHREFLHDADVDPRLAFAESLLAATVDAAALVVYSSFEGDVLAALATQLPQLADGLLDRRARIVDLLPIVRDHCAHPALRGSFSIKSVLPAFVPDLGYGDLAIRDGLTASLTHARLVDPHLDPARRAELRAQLLAYCRRDTDAMLALYRVLGAPDPLESPGPFCKSEDRRRLPMALRLGDTAPDFTADTTEGPIKFHDFIGNNWVVLFSHPKDFTPVCTTELGYMARIKPEFDKRGVKILGLSVDPVDSHQKWSQDIKETQGHAPNYPLIADPERKVADLYDMIHPNALDTLTVRSVFVIGPDKKIKLMLTYPASTGRNFDELLRVIDSLQLTSKHSVATPVNWKSGDDCIIVPSISDDDAKKKFPGGWKALKPYLRIVPQPS
jgi:alkyl hydroperoxide reductase subunit AhpC